MFQFWNETVRLDLSFKADRQEKSDIVSRSRLYLTVWGSPEKLVALVTLAEEAKTENKATVVL